MDQLVAQTGVAKQEAQHIDSQLRAATEKLAKKNQEISSLKVRLETNAADPVFHFAKCSQIYAALLQRLAVQRPNFVVYSN